MFKLNTTVFNHLNHVQVQRLQCLNTWWYNFDNTSSLCTNAPKPSYFWSGSSWLDWCEERFTTNLMSQALSIFLVKFDEFYSGRWFPIVNIVYHFIDEIRQNPLEYMEVLIQDTRGSQHLPIWSTSACRTMPHPLWWQHQFLASVLATCFHLNTTVFNYSNHVQVQICRVMWLVRMVFF